MTAATQVLDARPFRIDATARNIVGGLMRFLSPAIERVLGRLEGVVRARVDLAAKAAHLEVSAGAVSRERIITAVRAAGFEVPSSRL